MKNCRRMIRGVLFIALALCLTAAMTRGQDPMKVAPNNFKVLLENDQVRVLEFRSKPGEKIATHSHPAYVTYVISGRGKTKFTSPEGKTTEQEAKVGQATWHQAETHASESTGAVHVLLVELKK